MTSHTVRDYYDQIGEEEWKRLEQDPYHQLELLTNLHFMEKYLPEGGTILDAGGGPGRYTIFLAKKGFKVVILDISAVQLDIARQKVTEAGIPFDKVDYIERSLPNISLFADNHFDAVICFGPLSHLLEERDRKLAARELVRVAKPGAPLFVSVINRFAVFRTVLQRYDLHEDLVDPHHKRMFDEGLHLAHPSKDGSGFTDAYFYTPDELKSSFEEQGTEILAIAGCEGLAAHLQEPLTKLAEDETIWKAWMDLHWRTCTEPSILGTAEHLLMICRKI